MINNVLIALGLKSNCPECKNKLSQKYMLGTFYYSCENNDCVKASSNDKAKFKGDSE